MEAKSLPNKTMAKAKKAAKKEAAKKPVSPSERAREAGELIWDEKAGVYRTKDD